MTFNGSFSFIFLHVLSFTIMMLQYLAYWNIFHLVYIYWLHFVVSHSWRVPIMFISLGLFLDPFEKTRKFKQFLILHAFQSEYNAKEDPNGGGCSRKSQLIPASQSYSFCQRWQIIIKSGSNSTIQFFVWFYYQKVPRRLDPSIFFSWLFINFYSKNNQQSVSYLIIIYSMRFGLIHAFNIDDNNF